MTGIYERGVFSAITCLEFLFTMEIRKLLFVFES